MLCKYKVIRSQLERPEEVRSNYSREVVQVHLVVLCLGDHFSEEFDDEDKQISIHEREGGANLSQLFSSHRDWCI